MATFRCTFVHVMTYGSGLRSALCQPWRHVDLSRVGCSFPASSFNSVLLPAAAAANDDRKLPDREAHGKIAQDLPRAALARLTSDDDFA